MPKPKQTPSQQFGEVMGLAALLPISVIIGYVIGHYLDNWRGTTYFTVIFLILGAVAGIVSLLREIQKSNVGKGNGGA